MHRTANVSRIAASLLSLAAACGSGLPAGQPLSQKHFAPPPSSDEMSANGLALVGITNSCLMLSATGAPADSTAIDPSLLDPSVTTCGDAMNGLPPNLLGLNGLSANGLATDKFDRWFAADPVASNMIMKYLVRCSMEANQALVYTAPSGATYSWPGRLGLAPEWSDGKRIPNREQQLVSACVAAHANKYGAHVPISILGRDEDGDPLPVGADELSQFPISEGCFFGNLFHSDGVFAGDDRAVSLGASDSSLRACALPDRSGGGAVSNCPPIRYAGRCNDVCTKDSSGLYYTSCTVNGKTYLPLSTRIQPSVQYTCGDGVCQATEKCGTGTTWDNCGLDCGPCN